MKRYILAGTAVLAAILIVVFFVNRSNADDPEQHGFYGTITYHDCDCTDGAYADMVYITKLPDGPTKSVGVYGCGQGTGYYDTELTNDLVFEPGDYKLIVGFDPEGSSECNLSSISQVYHQYSKQQVNLAAYGPTGGGS